ncbi:MAG: phosphate acyltransferase PlsX [Pseudomonadota bacterium]
MSKPIAPGEGETPDATATNDAKPEDKILSADGQGVPANHQNTRIAIDAMGGDLGPEVVLDGAVRAIERGLSRPLVFVGPKAQLDALIAERPKLSQATVNDAPDTVPMDAKPSQILRRGENTSMWRAIELQRKNQCAAVLSCGNTGALMALSYKLLGVVEGIERPAISALWPSPKGRVVVLDVGATVDITDKQLVQFAIMGEAFFRTLTGVKKPTVGLLNVGAEEGKGREMIRVAAATLKERCKEMSFHGFVEGNDISMGSVNVVVTDGFSGNIALKSAEGAAKLVGQWLREALTRSWWSKLCALALAPALSGLKAQMDPSSVNGGVFLGIDGTVVKSHGGADAEGVASAILMAANLADHPFQDEIATTVAAALGQISAPKPTAIRPSQSDAKSHDGDTVEATA